MKLKNPAILIVLALIAFSCREDIVEFVDEQEVKNYVRAGVSEDALYFSNLVKPDSVFIDNIHEHVRLMDLNNDGINEFEIVSEEDTITIKDSNQKLRNYHIKYLYLRKVREDIFVTVESITYKDYVGIIQRNSILNFESKIWNPLDSVKILCYWEKNVTADFSFDYGLWNNRLGRYFAVHFQHQGRTIIAWIELSVFEYDNYALHNYASFILE